MATTTRKCRCRALRAQLTARRVHGPYRFVVVAGVFYWIPEAVPNRVADLVITHRERFSDDSTS